MAVRADSAVSTWRPPNNSVYKSSHPLLVCQGRGDGLQTDVLHHPPQLSASEIKQTFHQTWPVYWPSEWWAAKPHLPHPFGNRFLAPNAGLALAASCAIMAPGSPGSSRGELWPWRCIHLLVVSEPSKAFGGYSQQLPKPFALRILPVSPLLSTDCQRTLIFGGIKTYIWDKLMISKTGKVHQCAYGQPSIREC